MSLISITPNNNISGTNSTESNISTLARMIISVKNSIKTFFVGSEVLKQENIKNISAEFIMRLSENYNGNRETIEGNKLHNSAEVSTRFTYKTLSNDITELFRMIKKEVLNQQDKKILPIMGHADKSINIMLVTLYQAYQKADEHINANIKYGNNALLKSQIEHIIMNNFIFKDYNGKYTTEKEKVMSLLKEINQYYEDEFNKLKNNADDKIKYKLEESRELETRLKEYNLR